MQPEEEYAIIHHYPTAFDKGMHKWERKEGFWVGWGGCLPADRARRKKKHRPRPPRQTTCPINLTENGYLSNQKDLKIILNQSAREAEAKALAQGVVNHFPDISGLLESRE